ncbi:MAG: hypothetical protein WCW30_04575 [Candidatus Gracilibacteria bacterium]
MDKIKKFLQRLTKKERDTVARLIQKAIRNELEGLDIKKLKGFDGFYRIRESKIRIVFQKSLPQNRIINVDYRGGVYKNL